MKKRTRIILGISIPIILLTGEIIMTQRTPFDIFLTKNYAKEAQQTSREGQIAWLKAHEKQMTKFISSQYPKITSVQYEWDSMQVGTIGNGTPQGAGVVLSLRARFNAIKDSDLIISFALVNENSIPSMKAIYSDQPPMILRDGGWNIYE
jgi:hypothetical protein